MMPSLARIVWWWPWTVLIATAGLHRGSRGQDTGSNLVTKLPNSDLINKLLVDRGRFMEPKLRRVFLTGNATCNDGTRAGYYIRTSPASRKWIVFLEGGWYCFDRHSCATRWNRMQHLMSSKKWPEVRNVGGLLSSNVGENPHWWNANHVFVPYCTSDSWSGRASDINSQLGFSFMGATIVEQVIQELLQIGLGNASSLLLAGSSAGGTGVMLNLETVQKMLSKHPKIFVRGITDSGWFLDRTPYISGKLDALASVEAIKKGMVLWKSLIPPTCLAEYQNEPWRCFFGYRLYPTVSAPLFVFQWLFDEAQMTADNVGAPVTKQEWDYVHQMGDSLRNSFKNITSVFAPSCISHSVLTRRDWQVLKIDEVSLPQALRCWELTTQRARRLSRKNRRRNRAKKKKLIRQNATASSAEENHKKRRRKNGGNVQRKTRRKNAIKNKRREKNCRYRLVERCSWPQCNRSCPKLHNPVTGEEMDFIELLKSFGLDMTSVANALGIDIHTLNNMDHEELLNLLTQQAS